MYIRVAFLNSLHLVGEKKNYNSHCNDSCCQLTHSEKILAFRSRRPCIQCDAEHGARWNEIMQKKNNVKTLTGLNLSHWMIQLKTLH